ncbi:hypothetical protein FNU76_14960 [Chitinimonas arctica]|uniref:Uncharacterized protein n=1 Tax=Chitinimonas arctica TaxID=2594795 RepID=A0A516SHM8_9NEIS|nr:hypothetical protein [Chitinimonas arctica]QDQ27548.1 hypothetical protein FNU76_14960 [Chitinimonas arctica]
MLASQLRRKHRRTDTTRTSQTAQDGSQQSAPELPHEHDQSAESQSGKPRKVIRLAQQDNERGVLDTDRRSAYGMADGLPQRKTRP